MKWKKEKPRLKISENTAGYGPRTPGAKERTYVKMKQKKYISKSLVRGVTRHNKSDFEQKSVQTTDNVPHNQAHINRERRGNNKNLKSSGIRCHNREWHERKVYKYCTERSQKTQRVESGQDHASQYITNRVEKHTFKHKKNRQGYDVNRVTWTKEYRQKCTENETTEILIETRTTHVNKNELYTSKI